MGWLGNSHGIFKLHDSDNYCGSYMSKADAAEILDIPLDRLSILQVQNQDGEEYISELDLHRAWGDGKIVSNHATKIGSATRSLDEIILIKLIQVTLPGCVVVPQVQFGRKHADLHLTHNGVSAVIEFVGPSHFIPQYIRAIRSPLDRKHEVEDAFGVECVIWPYWIQRCTSNIRAIFETERNGLASVWSTKAHFGDFVLPDSADVILQISGRFGAVKPDGIGYMYGTRHTNKPIHPIIEKIKLGKELKTRLIPKGNELDMGFWLPSEI